MEIQRALELLKRSQNRIKHLKTLPPYSDKYVLWKNKVNVILEDTFGTNSKEYRWVNPYVPVIKLGEWTEAELQVEYPKELARYELGITAILQKYETLGVDAKPSIKTEQKGAAKSPIQLFDSLQFHSRVIEASRELFKDGHYRDAIYRAFVEVNNFVKSKASSQLDGKKLMSTVFSLDNPIIKLNQLETQTDKDEQEGFMFLFMGAMQGIRNPKAHENIIQDNPYIALKLIGFASLLIQTIDFWKAGKS